MPSTPSVRLRSQPEEFPAAQPLPPKQCHTCKHECGFQQTESEEKPLQKRQMQGLRNQAELEVRIAGEMNSSTTSYSNTEKLEQLPTR